MDPEAVETRLLDDDGAKRCPVRACAPCPEAGRGAPTVRRYRRRAPQYFDIRSPPPGDSEVISQVDLPSSKETALQIHRWKLARSTAPAGLKALRTKRKRCFMSR
jgi:hypothetical protein